MYYFSNEKILKMHKQSNYKVCYFRKLWFKEKKKSNISFINCDTKLCKEKKCNLGNDKMKYLKNFVIHFNYIKNVCIK